MTARFVKEIQEEIFRVRQEEKFGKEKKRRVKPPTFRLTKNIPTSWIKYQVQVNDMGVDEQIESYKKTALQL